MKVIVHVHVTHGNQQEKIFWKLLDMQSLPREGDCLHLDTKEWDVSPFVTSVGWWEQYDTYFVDAEDRGIALDNPQGLQKFVDHMAKCGWRDESLHCWDNELQNVEMSK